MALAAGSGSTWMSGLTAACVKPRTRYSSVIARGDESDARLDERIAALDLQQRRQVGGADLRLPAGSSTRRDAAAARDRKGDRPTRRLFVARVRRRAHCGIPGRAARFSILRLASSSKS
jgi:hypothetical protein